MDEKFFDESILNSVDKSYPIVKDHKNLVFCLKKFENNYQFFCEINDERLNSSEIKALLNYNEKEKFLSESDVSLLNYVAHRLTGTQTMYKIITDIGFIMSSIRNCTYPVFFEDEKLNISHDDYKLSISFEFDENSNIVMDIGDDGEFIYSVDEVFFITNNTLYRLNNSIPSKFYKEIFEGKNKFSIESFFSLQKALLETLKKIHNVVLTQEIEDLSNFKLERKVAKTVLEINKTNHFIIFQLRYKINDELFNVEDYTYAETIGWIDKTPFIKIVLEDRKLVQYISDESVSQDIIKELFEGTRIRASASPKSPFLVMLPISNLDNVVKRVIPKAEKMFEIHYKDGQRLELSDGKVRFELETKLRSKLNFFEFNVKFRIGNEYFDIDFLKDLMMKNKKYVQLKDGTTVNIENIREINKWIEFLRKYEFKKRDNKYQTESKVALELDEFLKDFKEKNIVSNDEYKNIIQELKERNPVTKVELPKKIEPILRDYQKEGVYWMHFLKKYGFNGILADEMGLGKTLQTLTVLAMEKNDGSHIVVCPKSLIYNWENEIKKYFPELRVLIIDGESEKRKKMLAEKKDYDVLITSYSMLQKDYMEYLDNKLKFNYLVLDEAHYVKNMKTLSAKAVRLVDSLRIIMLTGTPLENNLDELYGTFDLIMPEYLGAKTDFSREFVSKIERNNTIALELLQSKIRPFILRRTKKEVLKELPDKQEQVVFNEMTNKQKAVYNELLRRVKDDVNELIEKQGFDKSRIQVLSALLKLRQICNHPVLLDDSFDGENDISGKYNQFLELLEEVTDSGEKVLVFSQFTSMLDIFEKDLTNQGIEYLRLDGSTKNRQELVDQFNEDESVKVFLISLKAGGVGLNLTSASAVFLYDPWWNPMVEKQAMDRAHRIGQKNTVNIYKFITMNSIEEKILKLQERKGNLFENLVTEDKGFIKRLEWEDLMELFE